jgi:hypothetical protein
MLEHSEMDHPSRSHCREEVNFKVADPGRISKEIGSGFGKMRTGGIRPGVPLRIVAAGLRKECLDCLIVRTCELAHKVRRSASIVGSQLGSRPAGGPLSELGFPFLVPAAAILAHGNLLV